VTAAPAAAARRPTAPDPSLTGRASDLLQRPGLWLLRGSLAVVFIWFGALKVAGVPTMPAALIAAISPSFVDAALLATLTGAAEVALGTGLLVGRWQPAVLAGLAIQLTGTFLVLVLRPDVAFVDGNLLVLSASGEYVVKNIVLLAATLTLAGGLPPQRPAASRPRGARPPARVSSDLESLGGTGS
jgi:putative oxidoreductase